MLRRKTMDIFTLSEAGPAARIAKSLEYLCLRTFALYGALAKWSAAVTWAVASAALATIRSVTPWINQGVRAAIECPPTQEQHATRSSCIDALARTSPRVPHVWLRGRCTPKRKLRVAGANHALLPLVRL